MYIENVKIISLQDLLEELKDKELVIDILKKFRSKYNKDVEDFLHTKAIEFENSGLSSTHLVFDENFILLGFFSLANKPLLVSEKNYKLLTKNQRKKLCQNGKKLLSDGYIVNSYLLGQLGKNFNLSESEQIKGNFLLSLAFELLLEAKELINAKYVWLECRNSEKLLDFYKKFGFEKIDNLISKDGLVVMMMKLDRKN